MDPPLAPAQNYRPDSAFLPWDLFPSNAKSLSTPDLSLSVSCVFQSVCDTEETPMSQRWLWCVAELHHRTQPKPEEEQRVWRGGWLSASGHTQDCAAEEAEHEPLHHLLSL